MTRTGGFVDISGAMLVTTTQTSWIQEGWLNMVDLEQQEARGYFYLPSNRDIGLNSKAELLIEGVRLNLVLLMSSITFDPSILKYRFVASGQVEILNDKLIPDPNLTMTQTYFLETDFRLQLRTINLLETEKQHEIKPSYQSFSEQYLQFIEGFFQARATMFERLLHTEFAKQK